MAYLLYTVIYHPFFLQEKWLATSMGGEMPTYGVEEQLCLGGEVEGTSCAKKKKICREMQDH